MSDGNANENSAAPGFDVYELEPIGEREVDGRRVSVYRKLMGGRRGKAEPGIFYFQQKHGDSGPYSELVEVPDMYLPRNKDIPPIEGDSHTRFQYRPIQIGRTRIDVYSRDEDDRDLHFARRGKLRPLPQGFADIARGDVTPTTLKGKLV